MAMLWLAAAAALLVFWGIGAYNRLIRLGAQAKRAFAAVDTQLLKQLVWIGSQIPEHLSDHATGAEGAEPRGESDRGWIRLQAAAEQFAVVLASVRAQPLDPEGIASLVLAHEGLRTAWQAVLEEEGGPEQRAARQRQNERWKRLLYQTVPVRAVFNRAVDTYNAAIRQFPASVLARLLKLPRAGRLARISERG